MYLLDDTGIPKLSRGALPVVAGVRNCLGRQTIPVGLGSASSLTVPDGAIGAMLQADGGPISVSLDGASPTSTNGLRVDDGAIINIDTALSLVRVIARSVATNVQVLYFDKA